MGVLAGVEGCRRGSSVLRSAGGDRWRKRGGGSGGGEEEREREKEIWKERK